MQVLAATARIEQKKKKGPCKIMKKLLIVLLALMTCALLFACVKEAPDTDTTAPSEEGTPAPTETPTETPTEPDAEETTEAAEETTEEVTEPETLEVDLEKVTISSSLSLFESHFTTADKDTCVDDLVDVFGEPAIKDGVKIPLVYQGAIHLGDIDLSKYKKVTITYATSAASGTVADYETTQKRAMLTLADTKGELSPAEDAIIASAVYSIPSTTWQLTTVEIDLTGVDYSGALFLTFDFTEGVNLYHAVTGVVFEG